MPDRSAHAEVTVRPFKMFHNAWTLSLRVGRRAEESESRERTRWWWAWVRWWESVRLHHGGHLNHRDALENCRGLMTLSTSLHNSLWHNCRYFKECPLSATSLYLYLTSFLALLHNNLSVFHILHKPRLIFSCSYGSDNLKQQTTTWKFNKLP